MAQLLSLYGHENSPRGSPGFLLSPFGWAAVPLALIVSADPSLLVDLFGVTRERMHLIALALAHMEGLGSLEAASLLIRDSTRAVLQRVLRRCPIGIKRVLKHLPPQVLRQQNYIALVDLLDNPESARVLHHATSIDDLVIQVLAELPPSLRRPLSSAVPDWPRTLVGLSQSLQFLVCRGSNGSFDDLVGSLATVTTRPQLTALVREWIGSLPLPETMPPRSIGNAQRLDSGKELCSLAKTWHNCLDSYIYSMDAGHCAVYLWEDADNPAACLVRRRDRLGWFLDEVKGPNNIDLDPDHVEVIEAVFDKANIPRTSIVSAIEAILYPDLGAGMACDGR
jgi:hypothetical protein